MNDLLNEIGSRIVSGRYPPGTTLPTEIEFSREFGVGRNAVRESVKTLTGKQLVRTGRRSGTLVRPLMEWNHLDEQVLRWRFADVEERAALGGQLSHLRRVIEPEVAAAAAERATTVQILRLFEAYELMEAAVDNREQAIAADAEFHQRLFEAANNILLMGLAPSLTMLLAINYELSIGSQSAYAHTLPHHLEVAEAIRQRDPAAARKAAAALLSTVEAGSQSRDEGAAE